RSARWGWSVMPLESKAPAVGSLLQLRIGDQWWPSRLEDASDGALVVAWPTDSERKLVPVEPGSPMELLRVVRGDGTYGLNAVVHDYRASEVPVVRLR